MDGMEERKLRLLDRMRTLCARREYCEADIRKKLMKASDEDEDPGAGFPAMADWIIDSLKRDKYIDDFRYCRAFARDKSSISGWGRIKIRHALSAKGIDRECIAAAMEEIEPDAGLEKLEKTLTAKAKALKDDPYGKFKLLRFALSRGFEYDEVKGLVDSVLSRDVLSR